MLIVNRNTKDLLKNCLETLPPAISDIRYDVWIVDNASEDDSVNMVKQEYPEIHLICNRENLGFAKANNQALKRIAAPFALLLNSDTILAENSILHLYNFIIGHADAAIVGPKLLNEDETVQHSAYPLPSLWHDLILNLKLTRLLPKPLQARFFLGSFWNHGNTRTVGRISGACILIRMQDLREINYLDPDYFFYAEIHDLCWRLWKKNRQIWLVSESIVIHLRGRTSEATWSNRENRRRKWREYEKLLQKHYPKSIFRMSILLHWLGNFIAVLKNSVLGHSAKASMDKDLLGIDFDWFSNRLKEWFRFRFHRILNSYYGKPLYLIRFQKRLYQEFHINTIFPTALNEEAIRIQDQLTTQWNATRVSWERTGLMDFTCGALIYKIVILFKPQIVVETGVANGASSTFILSAMEANGFGELYSIDWEKNAEYSFVPKGKKTGWMVPEKLRERWHLSIGRTDEVLEPMLKKLGQIDLFFHDSDHSYDTMMFEYKTAWPYLNLNGILLSDDSRMNTAFDEFSKDTKSPSIVYKGRLGIAQKVYYRPTN